MSRNIALQLAYVPNISGTLIHIMYMFLIFQEHCSTASQEQVPQFKFYEEIRKFEKEGTCMV